MGRARRALSIWWLLTATSLGGVAAAQVPFVDAAAQLRSAQLGALPLALAGLPALDLEQQRFVSPADGRPGEVLRIGSFIKSRSWRAAYRS